MRRHLNVRPHGSFVPNQRAGDAAGLLHEDARQGLRIHHAVVFSTAGSRHAFEQGRIRVRPNGDPWGEKWTVEIFGALLPRHLEIIYEINRRFLHDVAQKHPGDMERQRRMSIIEEGMVPRVRMANLAIVGSHCVNGVAALHTEILKDSLFREFHEFYPEKFRNVTNGITPRRWLLQANPALSALITKAIGPDWIRALDRLKKLAPMAEAAIM